jgi:hypothetical protein
MPQGAAPMQHLAFGFLWQPLGMEAIKRGRRPCFVLVNKISQSAAFLYHPMAFGPSLFVVLV